MVIVPGQGTTTIDPGIAKADCTGDGKSWTEPVTAVTAGNALKALYEGKATASKGGGGGALAAPAPFPVLLAFSKMAAILNTTEEIRNTDLDKINNNIPNINKAYSNGITCDGSAFVVNSNDESGITTYNANAVKNWLENNITSSVTKTMMQKCLRENLADQTINKVGGCRDAQGEINNNRDLDIQELYDDINKVLQPDYNRCKAALKSSKSGASALIGDNVDDDNEYVQLIC